MGNWRTVNIVGTMSYRDSVILANELFYCVGGEYSQGKKWYPLSFDTCHPSLCGLNNWVDQEVDSVGNLSERDYDINDVYHCLAAELVYCVPSMRLKIHCSGENESTICIATITVDGINVWVGQPEVKEIIRAPMFQIADNLAKYTGQVPYVDSDGKIMFGDIIY